MLYRDEHWLCPRDGSALESVAVMGHRFMRCTACWGAFVQLGVLHSMIAALEGWLPPTRPVSVLRPAPCPTCRVPLERSRVVTTEDSFEIDTCDDHGVWFAPGRLARLLETAGLLGLEARRSF